MAKELTEKELQEKQERKEVASRRIFWFLVIFNVVLVIYLAIQIIILVTNK